MAAHSLSSRCLDITNFALLMMILATVAQFCIDQMVFRFSDFNEAAIKEFKINEVPVLYSIG